MLDMLAPLRSLTLLSVVARMLLAVVCGGVIGMEREYKRRPAGFRTHMLICLGAAMTTLISQYLLQYLHCYTDVARLGAQVVAGVGFIGAGAIVVTRRQRVKGLTTAAGLWTAAIIGLAIGAGFYEGGVFATALVLVAELLFTRLEYRILKSAREVSLYVEYTDAACLDRLLHLYQRQGIRVLDLEITRGADDAARNFCVLFSVRLNHQCSLQRLLPCLCAMDGIITAEKL